MIQKYQYRILLFLILLYIINGIYCISKTSITSDEGGHLIYGEMLLKGIPERNTPALFNSKMPISVLNTIPRVIEYVLHGPVKKTDWGREDIMHGRYITLIFSVLIILLVFSWSKKLYGESAGLFSVFLFICCPNNISNAVLVTTDSYSVVFMLATMYFLWQYCNTKTFKFLIYFSISLALSQIAKQSLIFLFLIAPFCSIIYSRVNREKFNFSLKVKNILLVSSISWVLINAGFGFYKMGIPISNYLFLSKFFNNIQHLIPGNFPIPFSKIFITGLDQAKYFDQLGGGMAESSFDNVTILGKSCTGGGFWYYYFVSLFFKTPITYLILFGWAMYFLIKNQSIKLFVKNEFFLLTPVFFYLMYMSFFYKTQCGIRQIIFIYPFIYILSGIVIKNVQRKFFPILIVLCLFLMFSSMKYADNYYAYTNEFIADKKNAYLYVGASNLNFFQSDDQLKQYLDKHPDIKMAPLLPQTGKFVLEVGEYLDTKNKGTYQWLRKLKPVDQVVYTYLLFDVKENDIK